MKAFLFLVAAVAFDVAQLKSGSLGLPLQRILLPHWSLNLNPFSEMTRETD
jgi:hypothetical protein